MTEKHERHEHDYYQTPWDLAKLAASEAVNLFRRYNRRGPGLVLEPGCGEFAPFAWAMQQGIAAEDRPGMVHAQDIQPFEPQPPAKLLDSLSGVEGCLAPSFFMGPERDFTKMERAVEDYDIIIGNPPFSDAHTFIWQAKRFLKPRGVLCYLLRCGYASPPKRDHVWKAHPLARKVEVVGRPSFTGDGNTDGSEYSLYFWLGDEAEHIRQSIQGSDASWARLPWKG